MIHRATNSERTTSGCPFKWLCRYGIGLMSPDPVMPLWIGKLWHWLMEVWWNYAIGHPGAADGAFELTLSCLHHQFLEYKGRLREASETFDPQMETKLPSMDDLVETEKLLSGMLNHYRYTEEGRPPRHVVMIEKVIQCNTITPSGNPSSVTLWAGKLDQLIAPVGTGVYRIGEHKTTNLPLDTWLYRNEYSPQAETYAVLVGDGMGLNVDAVVFDVARKAYPANAWDYTVKKAGGLSKQIPSNATYKGLKDAIDASIDRGERTEPWYAETLARLRARDEIDQFRRVITVRFEPGQLARARVEMYQVATMLRRWHGLVGRRWDWVRSAGTDYTRKSRVVECLMELGSRFPRNYAMCFNYGRPCTFRQVCQYRSVASLESFVFKPSRHMELDDSEENE